MANQNPIYVYESLKLLVCRDCRHAVLPDRVPRHLREGNVHGRLPEEVRRRFAAEAATMDVVSAPAEVEAALSKAEEALRPWAGIIAVQGRRCLQQGCRHLSPSEYRAGRHFR